MESGGFITAPCPQCLSQLKLPRELLGKQVKCPSCGTVFVGTDSAPPPPSPPPVRDERFGLGTDAWAKTPALEPRGDDDLGRRDRDDVDDEIDSLRRRRWRDAKPAMNGLILPPAI